MWARKLQSLIDSRSYYDHFDDHICNLDCFDTFIEVLTAAGLVEAYKEQVYKAFEAELGRVIVEQNGRLRPDISENPFLFDIPAALVEEAISQMSIYAQERFRRSYFLSHSPKLNPPLEINTTTVPFREDLHMQYFFDAVVSLQIYEQKILLGYIVKNQLKENVYSNFAEGLLAASYIAKAEFALYIIPALLFDESSEMMAYFS